MKKRIISLSLALVLVLTCMVAFTGCMPSDGPGVNPGYKSFNNGDLSFDYPESWLNIPFIGEIAGMNMIMDLEGTGNNINVISVPKTDVYDKIPDADSFLEEMRPSLEEQGMTVKDGEMEKGTTNGLDYVLFSFNSEQSGTLMYQTMVITTIGESTYLITVTEIEPNPAHVDALLSSLVCVHFLSYNTVVEIYFSYQMRQWRKSSLCAWR